MENVLRFEKVLTDITDIKKEKGYVYAYPPKRSWIDIDDATQFVIDAWKGGNYSGDLGIYLHVPFCPPRRAPQIVKEKVSKLNAPIKHGAASLCGFCNLYAMVGLQGTDIVAKFVDSLAAEVALAKSAGLVSNPNVSSVYLGGGTPSLLTLEQFEKIINTLVDFAGVIPKNAEFSLEASPDSFLVGEEAVDVDRLKKLVKLGFNRISLGIQSFNDSEMDYIGRPYGAALNEKVLSAALDAGFANVNGDLILGLPLQTDKSFLKSLHKMIKIGPQTITIYQHLIRKGTRFGQEKDLGILQEHDNNFIASNYVLARDILGRYGYVQESLNRWAIPAIGGYKQQEHEFNLVPSIGFGPSARSYALSGHYSSDYAVNARLVKQSTRTWADNIAQGKFPTTTGFMLDENESKRRYIIFKLMTDQGVVASDYEQTFGVPIMSDFGDQIQALKNKDLVFYTESGGLKFSAKGFQYSSPVAEQLFFSRVVTHREREYNVV